MSFLFGGRPQLSSEQKIAADRASLGKSKADFTAKLVGRMIG